MGAFAPARWSDTSRAYLVETTHLPALLRFVEHHDVQVVDERAGPEPAGPEKFTGPLPECEACGQPAARKAAATMRTCPACGAPWRVAALTAAHTPTVAVAGLCGACGRSQRGSFAWCSDCGAPMPALAPAGARPAEVVRPVIDRPAADPVLFADAVAETAAELDHMQRAAGER